MRAADTVLDQSPCDQLSHEIRNFHPNINEAQLKITGKLLDMSFILPSLHKAKDKGTKLTKRK